MQTRALSCVRNWTPFIVLLLTIDLEWSDRGGETSWLGIQELLMEGWRLHPVHFNFLHFAHILHLICPASLLYCINPACIRPVQQLSCLASVLSSSSSVLHPSCPSAVLFCIRPVLHPSCPAYYLSCIRSVLHPSCPASALFCIHTVHCSAAVLSCIWPVLHPAWPASVVLQI